MEIKVASTFMSKAVSYYAATMALHIAVRFSKEPLKNGDPPSLSAEDLKAFFYFFEKVKLHFTEYCAAHPEEVNKDLVDALHEEELNVWRLYKGTSK